MSKSNYKRKPEWLKQRLSGSATFASTKRLISGHGLNTVCRSALCPNLHECWSSGTATFLLLGNTCTRSCRFCAVGTSRTPPQPDQKEPGKIAAAVKGMQLSHVVLTSVNRDDLPDGGASAWKSTILAIREHNPKVSIECLIPDFEGRAHDQSTVMELRPEVLNHNIETVPSLYAKVRPQADYQQSLALLQRASSSFSLAVKSGLMVGMGETVDEVYAVIDDLYVAGCEHLTIGQYLQPSAAHFPVADYVNPDQFELYRAYAIDKGFRTVQSGPFVRSSYHAEECLSNT